MNTTNMASGGEEAPVSADWTVWLDEQGRIASFHAVGGYQRKHFLDHGFFMSFLQELQLRGFRFQ